jgi:hypothetical protein
MAPTPMPNAPKKPIVRAETEDVGSVLKVNSSFYRGLEKLL